LKRAWMRFWLCASVLAASLLALGEPLRSGAQSPDTPKRANELSLAGLRPGKDALAAAKKRFGVAHLLPDKSTADKTKVWVDNCTGRSLSVELNEKGMIQSLTAGLLSAGSADCSGNLERHSSIRTDNLKTGRGLRLGDPRDRVVELYGEPNSSGPSEKGSQELELLFYMFDWAGSDVPQVMEIFCDRATGRVVEMTLAFPSL